VIKRHLNHTLGFLRARRNAECRVPRQILDTLTPVEPSSE
jgi:hypothetical protein